MTGAGGCPPLIDIDMGFNHKHGIDLKCHLRTSKRYNDLAERDGISDIFLAFDEAGLFDKKIKPIDLRDQLDFEANRYNSVKSAVERTLVEWSKDGARVWIIEDIPDVKWGGFKRCVWLKDSIELCADKIILEHQNNDYAKMLDELEAEGYLVLRTIDSINDQKFYNNEESKLFFRDVTHLTKHGSKKIFENRSLQLDIK